MRDSLFDWAGPVSDCLCVLSFGCQSMGVNVLFPPSVSVGLPRVVRGQPAWKPSVPAQHHYHHAQPIPAIVILHEFRRRHRDGT